MCRGIGAIVGCRVIDVARPNCRRRAITIEPRVDRFRRRAQGKFVVAVRRAGKRVVVWLAGNGKYANRELSDPRHTPRRGGNYFRASHDRIGLAFRAADARTFAISNLPGGRRRRIKIQVRRNGAASREPLPTKKLLFWDRRGLGSVCLYSAAEFFALFHGEHRKLGPDALEISTDELRTRLRKSRRAVKVALLDQASVAGIGNLYASEILHVAGVHPAAHCDRLKLAQWERIHIALREVLLTAIRYEGSTLADGTYRNALNQSGSYQNHHRVYDRAGVPCGSCGRGTIRRIVQAQRSTFFCAHCQAR